MTFGRYAFPMMQFDHDNQTNRNPAEAIAEIATSRLSTLVILGSGLAGCYDEGELLMIDRHAVEQTAGHPQRIGLDRTTGTLVAIGRRHIYEGASGEEITAIIRIAAGLGITRLVVTNAAGGLDPRFRRGDIMLIEGVIGSLLGRYLGRYSPPGSPAVADRDLFDRLIDSCPSHGIALQRGIYAGVTGPSYETRAEIRMLRRMGASAVGMSTVPEIVAARNLGMSVVGLSLITNVASDTVAASVDHQEVLESGREAARRMRRVIEVAVRSGELESRS